MKKTTPCLRGVLLLLAFPWCAGAAEVSLGRGIPSDSFFYLRRQASPELGFVAPDLDRAAKACREGLLADDSLQLLFDLLGQTVARSEAVQWRKVLEGIEWEKLLGREWAFGARFEISILDNRSLDSTSRLDWIALFRVDPSERDRVLRGLRNLVRHCTTLEEKADTELGGKITFEAVDAERDGVPLTLLTTQQGESRLCVGGQGDVIAAASSAWGMRRSFQLLTGKGSGLGLVESEDCSRLMQGLPASESGELVFRPGLIFEQLRAVARAVGEAPVRSQKASRDVEEVVRVLNGIVDTLDVVRGVAVSETVNGRRLVETLKIELQEDASKRLLYPAFFGRPPLGDLSRMVPRGVSGFAATSGIDLLRLHAGLLEAMKKVLPDGRLLADEYHRLQDRAGLDVEQDILGLLDGRAVLLAFPPAGSSVPKEGTEKKDGAGEKRTGGAEGAGRGDDRVILLTLKEPARTEARLDEWAEKHGDGLKALGMSLSKVEVPGVPGNFRRMELPFPPGLEVTFGVSGDRFCAGTSRERLREALRVSKGEVESILEDPSYRTLELSPEGDPGLVGFRDLRDLSREVQAGLKMAGAVAAMIPEDPEHSSWRRLLGLAPRLERVVSALGFADLGGGWLSREGKGYRGKFVVTLRPSGEAPPAAPGEEKKPAETKRRTF